MSAINVTSVQVLVRVFPRSPLLVDRRAEPDPPRGPSRNKLNLARPVPWHTSLTAASRPPRPRPTSRAG